MTLSFSIVRGFTDTTGSSDTANHPPAQQGHRSGPGWRLAAAPQPVISVWFDQMRGAGLQSNGEYVQRKRQEAWGGSTANAGAGFRPLGTPPCRHPLLLVIRL
ncbi:hypothetical protein SKAU_G00316550 [Synaphobranchus kaupii]|uniref:Uncharacterized protein n=1 Tax=Synaphobranchus kaupii TaxID=118154 RepID=A0A9Q1ESR5_SYNKA|nr:hypothetical protein SKAU_G00316550 [Synaphobranchus kaupii]